MKQEIQCVEVGQLKTLNIAQTDAFEVFPNAIAGEALNKNGIELRLPRNDPNVRGVAFITRAGMCYLYEPDAHEAPRYL